jgi:hypothetical protein
MPTARELLDQVDALMRRNRSREKDKRSGPATLTDALGARRDSALAPTIILPDAERSHATPIGPETMVDADPISLDTLSDVPILTDVVDVWPGSTTSETNAEDPQSGASPQPLPDSAPIDAAVSSEWRDDALSSSRSTEAEEATPVRAAALHDAPGASVVRAAVIEEEFILDIPPEPATDPKPRPAEQAVVEWPPHEVPAPLPETQPAVPTQEAGNVASGVDWNAMAEEIRMQVLQRLDLYADTGLREQLGARLQPIVDRASAELVATINRELGELVRGYVADAIEREIETWRKRAV